MKVKITRLSKRDFHYHNRKELIGLIGEMKSCISRERGWKGISFVPDEGTNPFPFNVIHFARVKFEQVNDE